MNEWSWLSVEAVWNNSHFPRRNDGATAPGLLETFKNPVPWVSVGNVFWPWPTVSLLEVHFKTTAMKVWLHKQCLELSIKHQVLCRGVGDCHVSITERKSGHDLAFLGHRYPFCCSVNLTHSSGLYHLGFPLPSPWDSLAEGWRAAPHPSPLLTSHYHSINNSQVRSQNEGSGGLCEKAWVCGGLNLVTAGQVSGHNIPLDCLLLCKANSRSVIRKKTHSNANKNKLGPWSSSGVGFSRVPFVW